MAAERCHLIMGLVVGQGGRCAGGTTQAECCGKQQRLFTSMTQSLFPSTTGSQTCHRLDHKHCDHKNNGQTGRSYLDKGVLAQGRGLRINVSCTIGHTGLGST